MTISENELITRLRGQLPQLHEDLATLVAVPSISAPGYPAEELERCAVVVEDLLRSAGIETLSRLDLPNTPPIVVGHRHVDDDAPTVLMYCHYDVVDVGELAEWHTDPFTAVEKDGAIYGRGVADSKSNILLHIAALRAFGDDLPVNVLICLEGQEEVGGLFDTYPAKNPSEFACDAMIIADAGNFRPGEPTLTVALRGAAALTVEVTTLANPKHSGQFGGAAPDALITLVTALATLHDSDGNVAVPGLLKTEWEGLGHTDEEFRELAEALPGVPLFGTGSVAARTWSGPSISIIGIDCPSVDESVNAVSSHARARLSMRVAPGQSALEAQEALVAHLEALRPFGIALTVTRGEVGDGTSVSTNGPAYTAAESAMADVFGRAAETAGIGGSIPIVSSLASAVPQAEVILFGTADGFSAIHAPNERILVSEFEAMAEVETLLLYRLAESWGDHG